MKKQIEFSEVRRICENNKQRIVIFGITLFGLELGLILQEWDLGKEIFFSDNNLGKQNKEYNGIICINPKFIHMKDVVFVAVKSCAAKEAIFRQLSDNNIDNIYFFEENAIKEYSERDDDVRYLRALWRIKMGYNIDFQNPKSFNEKIQWLKIYDRNPFYTLLVDKVRVKQWVASKIGESHVIKTLGVWKKTSEIDFNILPDEFVIKCNHNSGNGMTICKNKMQEREKIVKRLEVGLLEDYFYPFREWPYKNVEKCIIAEEFLGDNNGRGLNDYKFLCFNGKVRCSFVVSDRFSPEGMTVDFYDCEWKKMPFTREYPTSVNGVEKPTKYDEMIEYAEVLSVGIPFVRVDFYEVNGNVYFGEMTFSPGAGFERFSPMKYDYILGEWLTLPIGREK